MAMRLLAPLRNPPFAALIGALTLVELGAHVGNFALVWLAVELIGDQAAYLQAAQNAAVIIGALLGGRLLDARDPRGVLVGAYLLRGSVALCPLLAAWTTGSPLVGMLVAAVGLALAQAQSDPALQASLTAISGDAEQRQTANALIFATLRVARLAGRGIPGLLTMLVPVLHLFSINAALILAAALLLVVLPRGPAPPPPAGGEALRGAFAGLRHMLADRELRVYLGTTAVSFGSWLVIVSLGPALIVHARDVTWLGIPPAGGYSLLLAAYGLGNILGTGPRGLSPSVRTVFAGQGCFGLAAIALGATGTLASDALVMPAMIAAIFVCGIGAVAHDLRLSNMIQASGPPQVVAALARARVVAGWSSMLATSLAAPSLFATIGVEACVALAGLALVTSSAWAYRRLSPAGGAAP
jgi:MFS family permease